MLAMSLGLGFALCIAGCSDDGSGWAEDTTPVCTPTAQRACYCNDGAAGKETCEDDGMGYHPCDCSPPDASDDAPDIDAPDIDAPDIDAPDIDAPDIDAPIGS